MNNHLVNKPLYFSVNKLLINNNLWLFKKILKKHIQFKKKFTIFLKCIKNKTIIFFFSNPLKNKYSLYIRQVETTIHHGIAIEEELKKLFQVKVAVKEMGTLNYIFL